MRSLSCRNFLLIPTVSLHLCSLQQGTSQFFFSLVFLCNLLNDHRELAFQIAEQFTVLGSPLNVQTAVIVGGMDMIAQAIELDNRPHVVVATPGRLVDHLRSSRAEWDLSRVKFLVRARTLLRYIAVCSRILRFSMKQTDCSLQVFRTISPICLALYPRTVKQPYSRPRGRHR